MECFSILPKCWPDICLGLAMVLFAPSIVALGLGEIQVTSKLGEHFSGRIPIISTAGESLDPSCFRLLSEQHNLDGIPLVDSARLTVNGGSGMPYLKVSSRKRIDDLAVRLLVKAGCESEITREYTILLNLPDNAQATRSDPTIVNVPLIEPGLVPPKPVLSVSQRDHRSGGQEWEIKAGENLASIAANIYPNSRRMQRKFIRHAIAANPEIFADKNPDALLPVGTVLHLPDLKELAQKSAEKKSVQNLAVESTAQPETKSDKPPASRKIAKAKRSGPEPEVRLQLTTGDLDISASGKITEAEREILREKQRILLDIDDMAANNLSLNHRLKQMEEHIQGLQAKLEGLERQHSEMGSGRPVSPAPMTAAQSAPKWPAYSDIIAFSAGGLGLLLAALWGYSKWKRSRADAEVLMDLDVDLDKVWEADAEVEKPAAPVSPPVSVHAGEQKERASVAVSFPETNRQTFSSEALIERHDVSDPYLEITLDSIESAIEEADIYLALGEKDRAIANLKYHIDSHPRSTVDLWFKLLEIYHDFDMRPEFEILTSEFRRYFNIAKPSWETMASREKYSRSIEDFPRLMDKIYSAWGSSTCLEYLHHLLLDNKNKGGLREGFELGVASDILLLIHLLEVMLGKLTDLPVGEKPSEEISALEFTFEPNVPVEPEKSDIPSHNIELNPMALGDLTSPLELEIEPQVAQPLSVAKFFPELDQKDVDQPIYPEVEKREFSMDSNTAVESEESPRDLPKLEWGVTPDSAPALSPGQIAKPELAPVTDTRSALERNYPRIAENITFIWGGPEASGYLESLVVDNRGGRVGFDKETVAELMMLSSLASVDEDVTDIWGSSGEKKLAAQKVLKPR